MHHIAVDRASGAESYQAAVKALEEGEIVGVFPEATISQSFDLKEFKTGAARMAMEAGVPILPVVIWGSQRIFTKNRKKDLRRGAHVRIVIGETFTPDPAGNAVEITAELKTRMNALLAGARSTYKGEPYGDDDTWWVPASLGGTAPTLEAAATRDREDKERKAAKRAAARKG
jgi:1-acyl-sn-glycerol-3-phosphate acyltransferase